MKPRVGVVRTGPGEEPRPTRGGCTTLQCPAGQQLSGQSPHSPPVPHPVSRPCLPRQTQPEAGGEGTSSGDPCPQASCTERRGVGRPGAGPGGRGRPGAGPGGCGQPGQHFPPLMPAPFLPLPAAPTDPHIFLLKMSTNWNIDGLLIKTGQFN